MNYQIKQSVSKATSEIENILRLFLAQGGFGQTDQGGYFMDFFGLLTPFITLRRCAGLLLGTPLALCPNRDAISFSREPPSFNPPELLTVTDVAQLQTLVETYCVEWCTCESSLSLVSFQSCVFVPSSHTFDFIAYSYTAW